MYLQTQGRGRKVKTPLEDTVPEVADTENLVVTAEKVETETVPFDNATEQDAQAALKELPLKSRKQVVDATVKNEKEQESLPSQQPFLFQSVKGSVVNCRNREI